MTQKTIHPLILALFVLLGVVLASFMGAAGPAQAGTVGTWTNTGTLITGRAAHTATRLTDAGSW